MAKKPRNRTADYAAYLAVRALLAVAQMATPRVAYAVADGVAWFVYTFVRSRRRVALENVRAAFPELAADPGAADRIVRGMFRHLIRVIVELLWLPRKLHIGNWRKHLALPECDRMLPLMLDERPVLAVTAHFGNWEMIGCALGLFGFRTYAIARVLDNPYIERFVLQFRQYTGQTIIAKKDDFDRLTAAMRAGGKVATLADQDAGERGVFVDFFGRPASTHKAIALMAMEFDAVILVTGTPRVRRADYPQRPDYDPHSPLAAMFYAVKVADVIDPREYANDPNAVRAITARYTAGLERLIRQHPEQYFWLHRRWKHQPAAKKAKPRAA
ncbi:lysophospholipid acyltransferase family protein [Frigoriglobus tundricola]|uniref:Lipid A biosynthesis lauroyl acyltransferase n=1 Tax=Frigoriglobus tundricola TaxID=2774151 RepID=A0A6M5YNT6_9BACT|nr:lipid A biosynthesis acyltransferase [Frigoriglobus tundricola]QJW95645.1 Lipid A biosynthesis lauroyl acyltransferase [Frigoriglobus tundricola]